MDYKIPSCDYLFTMLQIQPNNNKHNCTLLHKPIKDSKQFPDPMYISWLVQQLIHDLRNKRNTTPNMERNRHTKG